LFASAIQILFLGRFAPDQSIAITPTWFPESSDYILSLSGSITVERFAVGIKSENKDLTEFDSSKHECLKSDHDA
jgi:hypothetical protein